MGFGLPVTDEALDFVLLVLRRSEVAVTNDSTVQDRERDLDLVGAILRTGCSSSGLDPSTKLVDLTPSQMMRRAALRKSAATPGALGRRLAEPLPPQPATVCDAQNPCHTPCCAGRMCASRSGRTAVRRTLWTAARSDGEAGGAGDPRCRAGLQLEDMRRSRNLLWRSALTMSEDPRLRSDARVRGKSHPWLGLRSGGHGTNLSLRCPGGDLYVGQRNVQRSLQRCNRHGDLPGHARVQLVGLHRDAKILRRLFR